MKNGLGRIPKSLTMLDKKNNKNEQKPILASVNSRQEVTSLKQSEETKRTTQKGLPAGWTRATFIIEEKLNEKIRALAYWERLTVKEIIHEALSDYLKGKQIKPIPQKRIIINEKS